MENNITMQETSEKCKICLKTFSRKDEHLEWHNLQIKHMQSVLVELNRVKIFKCDFCTRGFLDPEKFTQHKNTYFQRELKSTSLDNNNELDKPYKCHECGWRFVKESTLETHSILHKPFPHICECGIGYYKKCDLHIHRRIVHPLLKPVQPTAAAPKVKTETVVKYELEDCVESESEPEQADGDDDKNYKPHSKIGPRLKATLQYKQCKSGPLAVKRDESGNCICPVCDKTFARRSKLNIHMRVHTGMPYKCDECPKEFTTKHLFTLHKQQHAGIKNFECKKCNKKLSTKAALETHMRTHNGEKPYACNICAKTFSQSGARNLHLIRHKGERKFKCEFCHKSFYDKHALALHTRIHTGEKPFSCKYCGKCFSDPSAHKRHELIHTGLKPHQCKLCPKAFSDYSALVIHTRRHQGWSVQCTICNKSFRSRTQMLNHIKISHETIKEKDKYECDYCAKRFMLKNYLVTHIVNGHMKTIPKVECEICGAKVKRYNLNIHLRNVHAKSLFKLKCDDCGMLFLNDYTLKNHKIIHDKSRNKNYECDYCHVAFFQKHHVLWHITRLHLGIQCDLCKLVFSTSRELRQHKSEGCKRCHVCHVPFPTKKTLDNHFTLKHLRKSERQMYECDYCLKQFPILANLKKHIKRQHIKQNFFCDHCNEVFTNRAAIVNHIWGKHMVSLYCSVCMKRFYNESTFLEHKRVGCKEQPKYVCEICDTTFPTSTRLGVHLLSHGPKSKECDMCGKKYKHKGQLIRHLRSAHGFKRK